MNYRIEQFTPNGDKALRFDIYFDGYVPSYVLDKLDEEEFYIDLISERHIYIDVLHTHKHYEDDFESYNIVIEDIENILNSFNYKKDNNLELPAKKTLMFNLILHEGLKYIPIISEEEYIEKGQTFSEICPRIADFLASYRFMEMENSVFISLTPHINTTDDILDIFHGNAYYRFEKVSCLTI